MKASIDEMEAIAMQEKQAKKVEQLKSTMESFKHPSKRNMIIIAVVVVLLAFNILWTLMQGKITSEVQSVKAEMAKFEQRLATVEQGGVVDLETLRTEFDGMKKVGESYSANFAALLKAEMERVDALKKEVEMRQSWLEDLQQIASQDAGK